MGRPHGSCTEKLPSRRGFWDDEYDHDVSRTKTGNWAAISKKTPGMGGRVERSSRARWSNNRSSRHDQLPGRTDNDVKNLWNTKLKKKLSAMGIDPVTHKPFSQILADYGNIGGFPTAGTSSRPQFGTLNRALKTTIILSKSQKSSASAADCCGFLQSNKSSDDSNQYMDLLSELQAIKSITESTNYSSAAPDAINIVSPPSSLSSSSSLTSPPLAAQEKTCTGFSWCDFLLEDAFLPLNVQQAASEDWEPKNPVDHNTSPEDIIKISSSSSSSNNNLEAAASSSSFVEAMLSREDDDMFLDFPGLSEEPFYY
nr:transcription factor MYB35-like isoform X2 [Ipomoea trifida]